MHPSLSQKIVPVILPAEGTVFGFFLGGGRCGEMTFLALSFGLWIEVMRATFEFPSFTRNRITLR